MTTMDIHEMARASTFDSRDVQKRIDELRLTVTTWDGDEEQEDLCDACEHSLPAHDGEREWCPTNDPDEQQELIWLEEFAEDASSYSADWPWGATLIADSHFPDYARQFAEDIGSIDRQEGWPSMHIDWDAAAGDLKMDYTEVELLGNSFWVR